MAEGFPRASDAREQGRNSNACYDLASEVTHHHFREATAQGCEYQEARVIGTVLGPDYHKPVLLKHDLKIYHEIFSDIEKGLKKN